MKLPGKIPLKIRPLFWLVAALLGWMWTQSMVGTVMAIGVIVVSILVHELGHAWVAQRWQQQVRIELAAFGGFTYRQGPRLRRWQEVLVTASGPMAGFCLALVAYGMSAWISMPQWAVILLHFLGAINIFWTLVNLLPILPLDGGHLLSLFLEWLFGNRGTFYAVTVSCMLSVLISLVFFVVGWFLAAALFVCFAFDNFQGWKVVRRLQEVDRSQPVQKMWVQIQHDLDAGHVHLAIENLEKLRQTIHTGLVVVKAGHLLIALYRKQGAEDQAYLLLQEMEPDLISEEREWLLDLALDRHHYPIVLSMASRCFAETGDATIAMKAALAAAALGRVTASLGWLDAVLREGRVELSALLARPEWDEIRHHPEFVRWCSTYKLT